MINPYRFGATDFFTAGLWGAYGLTLLLAGYAGSAIRVRRSNDNAEQDIGFSGSALDTAALATFVGVNSGYVKVWYDQSGAVNDLVQTTTANQPMIADAGTYTTEVLFDGLTHELITTNSSGTPTAFTVYTGGRNRLGVAQAEEVMYRHQSGTAQYFSGRDNSRADFHSSRVVCGAAIGTNHVDGAITFHPATYTTVHNRAASGIANQATAWIDGVQQTTITTSNSAGSGNFTANAWALGSDTANNARAGIATFLIYEIAHTAGTIGAISALIKPLAKIDTIDSYTTSLWGLYGLRRLLSAYAGNCIKVRRSSDSTTLDIGFHVSTHLFDSAALLTFVGAGSGYIDTWYDQSGGTNNFVQATTGKQPRIVNSGVLDTGLTFDATDDQLATANNSAATNKFTCFVRARCLDGTGTGMLIEQGTGSGLVNEFQALVAVSDRLYVGTTTNATNYTQINFLASATQQVIAARGDRTQATGALQNVFYSGGRKLTGVSSGTGTVPSGNYAADKWYLGLRQTGSALPLTGWIDTVAIYEAAVSDADVDRISRALG